MASERRTCPVCYCGEDDVPGVPAFTPEHLHAAHPELVEAARRGDERAAQRHHDTPRYGGALERVAG